jgi:hypothetical protein
MFENRFDKTKGPEGLDKKTSKSRLDELWFSIRPLDSEKKY